MSHKNVFDDLKKIVDNDMVFNLLNAYMLFYNRYYKITENMFAGLKSGDNADTNHNMELLMDFIDEYNDNIKTIRDTPPSLEMGEHYILYINDVAKYYAKSCIVLLLFIVNQQIINSNWMIEFSET